MRARTGLGVLVAFVVAAAAACTSGGSQPSGSAATPPAAHQHTTETPSASAVAASPKQLRSRFEQLYGQHSLLAVRLMRGLTSPSKDFAEAAATSLRQNTDALSAQVAAAYGGDHGDRFKRVWQRYDDALVAYANAVASGAAAARQEAREDLLASSTAHGTWLENASKGRVKAAAATRSMRVNADHLMKQIDAFAARDYDRAFLLERAAYEHMYGVGSTLAKGSLTPQVAAGLDAPTEQLRSAFGMLLGEHMELVVGTQRATFAGAQQFTAAAAQVNANTAALGRAMGAIVGPHGGAEFQEAWAEHVEGLLDYSTAVAAKDAAAKAKAEKDMHTYAVDLAVYFSHLAPKQLDFVTLTHAVTAHDAHLVNQINAYAARDYAQAQRLESEGYQQMLGVSDTLVRAIQHRVKSGMPVGGSQTGGGATALGTR